ncbi:TAXI family TRAP transporter solute-binding subunit [Maritimibacter sp. UBA3975]|uniref:TAXI family TRAP transporter solute-binding subunit n=1 Tax=Maritimibacter sp. UBA3975 TaxID=1946833 RepID=UPI000C0950F0|nr:TAXI family TRAP transporter solute-binding subunit [Maritimibacter sp. UBA3975]MAM60081.1 hypothetical protein [Maritimibacter sp.]|tara:strand:+ start:20513 stop:21484 length:972 start_codon:yes stop_codon:yes gene_type:complete
MKHLITATVLAAGLATTANAQTFTAETGNPTGMTNLSTQVIANYSDIDMQINSGQTLTKACMNVATGKVDVAVCPPTAYNAMTRGAGPFKNNADEAMAASENIRALYGFTNGIFHAIVRATSSIETFDDFAGRRVFTGPPAGAANAQAQSIIGASSGLVGGQDFEVVRLGWGAAIQAFQDNQFEAFMFPSAVGNAAIEQLGEIRLIDLPDAALETEVWEKYEAGGANAVGVIPAGTYSNVVNEGEVQGAENFMQTTVNKDMSDDDAYALTKAFWENLDKAKGDIRVLAPVSIENAFTGMSAKLHPGAMRYYEEVGVTIPDAVK